MANTDSTTRFLEVPGARLGYEVHGSGPLLLLVGAPMGIRGFTPLVPFLAEDHSVVTYDPRGLLGSSVEDPDQPVTVELLTEDVHRLLSELGLGPAYVFGNSGGTAIGLELVARYPDHVRALVAHEPPLIELLPDGGQLRAAMEEIRDTYANAGRNEGLKKYVALTGVDRFTRPPGGGRHEVTDLDSFTPPADVRVVLDRFFLHMLLPTVCYRPDLDAVRAASGRIVVGGGTESKGQLAHRAAVALADELRTSVVDFPGDHTGFQAEPEGFARVLRKVLTEAA